MSQTIKKILCIISILLNTHYIIRQFDVFNNCLDECWLLSKMKQANGV